MKTVKLKVPGKLIIVGEHLVLAGCQALAVPLPNLGMEIMVSELAVADGDRIKLDFTNVAVFVDESADQQAWLSMMQADLNFVKKSLQLDGHSFSVKVKMTMPPGVGGGTSASWSVGLVKCLVQFCKINFTEDELIGLVASLEDSHHGGKASGVDHLTIWYQQPAVVENMQIKLLPDLNLELMEDCYLVCTGKPKESTAEMVKIVMANLQKEEVILDQFMEDDFRILSILADSDEKELVKDLNRYGRALEKLGAVNETVVGNLEKLRELGCGAKVCGAGGLSGGAGLCLIHPGEVDRQLLETSLEKMFSYRPWALAAGWINN